MFWLGFYACIAGATWLVCAVAVKNAPYAAVSAAIGAAVFASGVVLMVGAKILNAIRELKDSLKKQ